MKYLTSAALVLAVAVAACEKKSPAAPTLPLTFVFNATLSSASENPPIANAEAGSGGTATITMTVTRDSAGSITAASTVFQVNLTNVPATAAINIAHIHEAPVGVNGSIVVNTGLSAGNVVIAANGTGSFSRTVTNTSMDVVRALIVNTAAFYFNVHSSLNPGGVVRGQLTLTSSS